MTVASFTNRTFRIAPATGGGTEVVLTSLVTTTDAHAVVAALELQRRQDFLAPGIESADQVLALRALMALVDQFDQVASESPGAPVTLTRGQVAMLAEAVTRYVSTREDDGYLPPAERERLARLRTIGDRLFDLVADFAGAEAEAAELSA